MAVGAQVLVAETAHDLEIAVQTGNHQHLLEKLRGLGQRVEFAGIQAAGHQKVARALGRGFGQHRSFHFHKAALVQIPADGLGHLVTQTQIGLHARAPQIQIAPSQAQVLARVATVFNGERRRPGRVQQLPLVGHHFNFAGDHGAVDHAHGPGAHLALDGQHVLGTQDMRVLMSRGRDIRAEDHLGQTVAVAQVYENQAAVVAPVLHPAHQADLGLIVGQGQLPAVVTALPVAQVFNEFLMFQLYVLHLLSHWLFPLADKGLRRPAACSAARRCPDV